MEQEIVDALLLIAKKIGFLTIVFGIDMVALMIAIYVHALRTKP